MQNPKFIFLKHSQVEYFAKIVPNSKGNILFLHGFGGSFFSHQKVEEMLDDYNYYAINYPGHGKTVPIDIKDFNMNYYAELVTNFIEKMQLNNIILIAHSLGGAVGTLAYLKNSKAFKKVILIGPINKTILKMDRDLYSFFFATSLDDWKEKASKFCYFYKKYLQDQVFLKDLKAWIKLISSKNFYARGFLQLGPSCLVSENLNLIEHGIKEINCDFYMVYGEFDYIVNNNAIANYYQKINPNCKVLKIENSGHTPWLDDPKNWYDILIKIINNQI